MIRLSDIRIRPKLVLFFLITGVIPLVAVGFFSAKLNTQSLMEKSFNHLLTIQSIRKGQIEDYFTRCFADIQVLAEAERIEGLVNKLEEYKATTSDIKTSIVTRNKHYLDTIEPFVRPLTHYVATYRYNNLILIDADKGNVLFSVTEEADLGTSLSTGQFKNSGLATAWRKALDTGATAITDFHAYSPSANQQSAFIAEPVRDTDGTIQAVLVLQLTAEEITHAVDSRKGMGETGESYLFGISAKTGAYELRSNLRTMGNDAYVVGHTFKTPLSYWQDAVAAGRAGGHKTYIDSVGNPVLVAFDQLEIPGLDWYLVSKINKDEVTAPIDRTFELMVILAGFMLALITGWALYFSKTITTPIVADMRFAQAISEGNLEAKLELPQKDELGDLARALNSMAKNLHELDWLKRGKEGLHDEMTGEMEVEVLCQRLVTFVTKHMNAQLGALYLLTDTDLKLKASYAFSDRDGIFDRIQFGEGMVGQAAKTNETLSYSNIRKEVPALNYGAGEGIPSHFMAAPIAFEEQVVGVLLLGSVHAFSPLQLLFIDQNMESAAILLNTARSRQVIQDLLHQAQEQQEELRVTNDELEAQAEVLKESEAELQAQQEELRVTNEELEEQTSALKESEAELQAQQEELRVTNEELEERTLALEEQKAAIVSKNADLVKAQEIVRQKAHDLEQASKYKSEFLANMSHELRTPLNSILILSQLLGQNKEGNLTTRQVESSKAIHSSGSDLLTLINEVLDLSKVEAGKIELVIDDLQIETLITDLQRLFNDMAAEKGITFDITVTNDLPNSIRTDSQRLQQVLRNLLANAFKFTRQGIVSVSISRPSPALLVNSELDPATSLAFSVKDDGIGIPLEKQEAIFQAFQQADGSTSRTYGGTGLGLSISKELTALLGGIIRLQSIENQGSTFTIILPETYTEQSRRNRILPAGLIPEKAEQQSSPAAPPDTSEQEEEDSGTEAFKACAPPEEIDQNPTISSKVPPCEQEFLEDDREHATPEARSLLIIEDDRTFAKVMRDFGRERGFLCLVAEDGETGLHFADYYKPSAIILDIGLPGIDGWTVMERLKDNPDLRHIPVHFMSAKDSSLDAMRMGAIGFLSKPVTMENIEEAFSRLEDTISRPVSNLLLVEDDTIQRQSIELLIGNGDVRTTAVSSGHEAFEELVRGNYDCMILDLGLEDMSGFDLLEKIRLDETACRVPVIIYTGRDLTVDEEKQLNRYAESIIIKGAKSPERLLEESALFLHRIEADLPADKQKMLQMVHDKESVLSNKTVLLVDDDMRNVFALTSVLEEKNMDVIAAKNGLECLDKLKENAAIDCILMDIMMPEMDGYEAMTEIRKQRQYEKLPIIALTAKAMKGDRSKCIEAGASDYLAKPVNTDKLLSMMRVWLY
ncbi:response regulator [Pseudodesulfovibrio sediminis]|uniref:histidine kinase n=1 Tax=Pseudodesulfovibrio sediminis TaxID=2810563 RepID=A0ABN6EW52_9BACT|nr:response regulator [Pseudodesulfovibrio sediminis]BCS89494.1 hypothetical protein PSDVSF_27360 [Pseudodesulfovibrio sediminis]